MTDAGAVSVGTVSAGSVAVIGGPPAGDLVAGLADRGHRAELVGPGGAVDWELETADGLAEALARLDGSGRGRGSDTGSPLAGPLAGVVWAWTEPSGTNPVPLAKMDTDAWARAAERPVTRFLSFLQGSFRHFGGRPGTVVVLAPTMPMVGAPAGLSAWATAAEGQRALVKTAARNWGRVGITLNSVAVPAELLAGPGGGAGVSWQRPGLPAPSLDRPTLRDQVAGVVSSLLSADWRAVTGATVGVDGGVWMAAP